MNPLRERLGSPVAVSLVLVGAVLRLHQYLYNRSLFVDEAALALNLRDRSLLQLIEPLSHAQAGPFGYLFLQKLFMDVFGSSEYVLRVLPLLAGLAALPLFLALARRILPAHLVSPAVALFAISEYQIFWATDMKPYAFDVLACVLLLLFADRWLERHDRTDARALAWAGALLPWFSHASVFVMAGVAVVLAFDAWRADAAARRTLVRAAPIWLIALPAVVHALLAVDPAARDYLDAFWADGFLPLPFSRAGLLQWWITLERWIFDPLGYRAPWSMLFLLAATAGSIVLVRQRRMRAALLFAPIAFVVCASLAGLYPVSARWTYSGRVVLFTGPIFYIVAAAGAGLLRPRVLAAAAAFLLVAFAAIPALARLPYSRGEVRPALDYVSAHAQPGDAVYLTYASRLAAEWYRPRIGADVVYGVCAQANRQGYLDDIEQLRGRRLWLVLAYDLYLEHMLFLDYMSRNAVAMDSVKLPLAEVRLYDFRDGPRVPASAEALNPIVHPDARTDCTGVFADFTPRAASDPAP